MLCLSSSQVSGHSGGALCPVVQTCGWTSVQTDLVDQKAAVLLRAVHWGLHTASERHLAGTHPTGLSDCLQRSGSGRPCQRDRQIHTIWRWAAGVSWNFGLSLNPKGIYEICCSLGLGPAYFFQLFAMGAPGFSKVFYPVVESWNMFKNAGLVNVSFH